MIFQVKIIYKKVQLIKEKVLFLRLEKKER